MYLSFRGGGREFVKNYLKIVSLGYWGRVKSKVELNIRPARKRKPTRLLNPS